MKTMQFGVIGAGNMGFAMLKGAMRKFGIKDITFTDASADRIRYVTAQTGISQSVDNRELVRMCRNVVLAVKPQYISNVMDEIKNVVTGNKIIISILPGVEIAAFKRELGKSIRVVRAMPNTPALVGEGMTSVSFSGDVYTEDEKKNIIDFFSSFGKCEIVEEKLMDAVVAVSGSSPAYAYIFMEALADSAVKYGLPRNTAYRMAAQTLLGAAKMVLETDEHPAALKDKVCSPGGTTIAAVSALEEYGFRNAVIKAADRCYEKTLEMKK